ncbi:O-antigen translocase [Algibacter pectinivorans]|uniref:Polysaccharide transporter, PST family n=1 Tax=Algibacter pectinivorans TaxID=870482 RepID=A0A1I1Q6L7_9FLAO|nr:O-antigen translocase [Algibacter pectinivorans]SFD17612.1 polysaccharide transporter, PST family [Algibacter pectinivorans]
MFEKILNNTFIKVFSYNSIVVFGKLLTSFVVSKVSAVYLGPSGYAIVGNFKNLLQGILGITASGFQSGIIKYIAENKNNTGQLKIIISSVIVLCVGISSIISLLLIVFSKTLSVYVLKDESLAFVFRCLAVLLPLVSLNFLIVHILNGLQKFKLYTAIITLTNIFNALLTFLLVYYLSLKGALYASIIIPALGFITSLFFSDVRELLSGVFRSIKNITSVFLKSISTYIVMAIYSSILISLSYLFIRNKIIADFNTSIAGLWEAMNKISVFYMMFFSSLFTLYLLPKLSENKTILGYKSIMKTYFKYIIPFIIVLFLVIFVFRVFLIKIILTAEFESIEQYFYLQLIGDFIKIIAFSLAYQFHAKKMVTFYFVTDAILYISFYLISMCLIEYFDLMGVFYSYILSTLLYLISVSLFIYFNNSNYLKEYV